MPRASFASIVAAPDRQTPATSSPLEELVPLPISLPPGRRLDLDPIALTRPVGSIQPLGYDALEPSLLALGKELHGIRKTFRELQEAVVEAL
jgi:hypothetical protein